MPTPPSSADTAAPRTLRVGIVGCGNISANHLEAFQALDSVTVAAVCDVDGARAAQVAAEYSVEHAVDSVQGLLELGLDIVSVCTPHPTHQQVVLQAAAAGVHVLCEKPIAVDVPAAEQMVQACAEAGVKLGVLFQRRFWPAAAELRAQIDSGALGTPVLGQVSVMLHREHEYYSAADWRGTWAADGGGVLMTQAIHYLDLLQWYLGDVARVQGEVNTYKHGEHIEVEDSATALLTFASGAMATVMASTSADPALGVQIRITGSNGASAELSEFPEGSDGRLTLRTADHRIDASAVHPAGVPANVALGQINGALKEHHRAQIAQFVAAVREDLEPAVTGEEAVKSLRILLAVYESARTGRPVDFAPPSNQRTVVPDSVADRLYTTARA
ncbi:Gfo/Idh/MocA family protein [Glutamicibacter protophormiae]|uniref:Gfo/Idh/MocA family protein n=1 Tax=Glutamicibacter protophormiae TaxID=37930 RepID=UPI00332AE24C